MRRWGKESHTIVVITSLDIIMGGQVQVGGEHLWSWAVLLSMCPIQSLLRVREGFPGPAAGFQQDLTNIHMQKLHRPIQNHFTPPSRVSLDPWLPSCAQQVNAQHPNSFGAGHNIASIAVVTLIPDGCGPANSAFLLKNGKPQVLFQQGMLGAQRRQRALLPRLAIIQNTSLSIFEIAWAT